MSKGRARIAVGQGLSVWVLEAPLGFGDAAFHAHHAIQFTAVLEGSLALSDGSGTIKAPLIAVDADVPHRFEAAGLLAFVFVEPESRLGRCLAASLFGGRGLAGLHDPAAVESLRPLCETFGARLSNEALLAAGRSFAEALAPDAPAPLPDDRVRRIIARAAAHPGEPLHVAAAAAGVHLSPSRLRHLFVDQTGLAFKTYMLWQRLVRAVRAYSEGHSLTEAAHGAGFADSAHFSRAFKRTFGLPATTLTRI